TEGELLLLRCDPHTVEGTLPVPDGWTVLGIDSGVKHSVAGAGYTGVRVAAFMGAKILSDRAGSGFGGWLCRVGSARYHELVAREPLPETLSGADFVARHGGILDTVTHVESDIAYPVRAATEHPIHEAERVERFVECLRDASPAAMSEAGACMRASHASYSACGLGAAETDLLMELACDGPGAGAVAGAKITGGGSGGTVCLLCRADDADRVARDVVEAYGRRTGLSARVVRGTSPGAMAVPVRRLSIA
ncbi:MAG: GHMP kinase, partial [Armatimonadota bacterium]